MRRFFIRIFLILCLAAISVYLFNYSLCAISKNNQEIGNENEDPTPSVPDVPLPDEETKEDTKPFFMDEYLSSFNKSTIDDGYIVTDAVFDENCILALCDIPEGSFIPQNAKYEVDGGAYFTMWPRMGYIVLADGTQKKLLYPNGSPVPVPEGHDLSAAGARDKNGTPVFRDWSAGGAYVTILPDGSVAPSDYDPVRDSRGLNFDYPSYYGVTDNEACQRVYTQKGFGYTIDGEDARDVITNYRKAFNYSEGYGVAVDAQDRLYFFNEEGRLRIGGLSVIMFYGCGDVLDERSLGYYYFDEGLTRVTKKSFSRGKLISQYQTFIDREGDEFKTPADFSVYSYSNGRILLVKDGKHGYMTSRGRWICTPEFTYARPFFEGLAVVGEKDGKKGVIDRDGNYVISPVFDEITDCSGGVICAYSSECGWQIFNKKEALPVIEQPENETEAIAEENSENISENAELSAE